MTENEILLSPPGQFRQGKSVVAMHRLTMVIEGDKALLHIWPRAGKKLRALATIRITKKQALNLVDLVLALTGGRQAGNIDDAIARAAKAIAVSMVRRYLKQHHPEVDAIKPSDLPQSEITADDLIIDDDEIAAIISQLSA